MSEHVGESQIDVYARTLFALLRPGGVLLNHAIAALDPDATPLEDLFSTRYVFPDGEPLPLSRVQLALERAGFQTEHVEGFREDYAVTLRHWTRAAGRAPRGGRALAGVERTRVWRLYLRAAGHGFEAGDRPSTRCARASTAVEWPDLADVAQLARASPCHGEGRGFESLHPLRGSLREKPPPEGGERSDCVLTVFRRVVAAAEFVEQVCPVGCHQ